MPTMCLFSSGNFPIYILKTRGKNNHKWGNKCRLQNSELPERWSEDSKINLPRAKDTDTKKWGTAALAVLKFILEHEKQNPDDTRFTIAVAEIKDLTKKGLQTCVVVAGNLELLGKKEKKTTKKEKEVENLGFGPDHQSANPTLMYGIQKVLIAFGILTDETKPFIFLRNPFDGNHMKRHAEMQLTR